MRERDFSEVSSEIGNSGVYELEEDRVEGRVESVENEG